MERPPPFDSTLLTRSIQLVIHDANVADITGIEHLINTNDANSLATSNTAMLQYNPAGPCLVRTRMQTLLKGQSREYRDIKCVQPADSPGFFHEEGEYTTLGAALNDVKCATFRRRPRNNCTFIGNLRQLSIDFPRLHTVTLHDVWGQVSVDLSVSPIRCIYIAYCNDIEYVKLGAATSRAVITGCDSIKLVVGSSDEVSVTTYNCMSLVSLVGISNVIAAECAALVDIPSLDLTTSMIGPRCNALRLWRLPPTVFLPPGRPSIATLMLQVPLPVDKLEAEQRLEDIESRLQVDMARRIQENLGSAHPPEFRLRTTPSLCLLYKGEQAVLCRKEKWDKLYAEYIHNRIEMRELSDQAATALAATPVALPPDRFDFYISDPNANEPDTDRDQGYDTAIFIRPHGSNVQGSRSAMYGMDEAELAATNISFKELKEILCEPSIPGQTRSFVIRRHECRVVLLGDIPFTREFHAALSLFSAQSAPLYIEKNNVITSLNMNYETFHSVTIRTCPALRHVQVGIFTSNLKIQECPSLLFIHQPLIRAHKASVVKCESLVGVFGNWGRLYVQDCPALQRLPYPVSRTSRISVGPGCPRVPWPDESVFLSNKAVFLPLLVDPVMSALYMQDTALSDVPDDNPNKAEFLRQVELFETSARDGSYSRIDELEDQGRPITVYPQRGGTYTYLSPPGRNSAVVYVAGDYTSTPRIRTELSRVALYSVASMMVTARQVRNVTNAALPFHIWHHIADFIVPFLSTPLPPPN